MRIQWICISVLLFSAFSLQIAVAEDQEQVDQDEGEEAEADADVETESEAEASEPEERVERRERPNLPAGLETVDPKELGLSEGDIAKYFGNVKQLQTLNLPGSKAQIMTVGFDDNEKLNLQNFEQLPMAGLEGRDKSVAQSAFKQFQSVYGDGNGTVDLDSLTTLFSRTPKLDVLESLDLIPPGSNQQQSSSQKVESFQDEERRVNQHIKQTIEQEERDAHNANLQQQNPYQFVHPNLIPQQPIMFLPPPGYAPQPHPPQMYYPFPPGAPAPTMHPPQQHLVQVVPGPSPRPFMHPQLHLQQVLEEAKKQQEEMPPVLVQPPVPRRPSGPPPGHPTLQARPAQQQFVRVRPGPPPPFAPTLAPFPTAHPQIMQIRPAQPQYVQIRQKGEPRQPQQQQEQLIQVAQSPLGPVALPASYFNSLPGPQQYITSNGQVLQQFQVQPTPSPTAGPMELNYAHQSHPLMIIQNPPEMGHTAFLNFYKEQQEQQQLQQQQQTHFDHPPLSEELTSNSLHGAPAPGPAAQLIDPSFYAGNQEQQFLNQQLANIPVSALGPQSFSTIYKQIPVVLQSRPMLVEQQIQRPFHLQQQLIAERPRPIGTHYRGRHIASVRRPFRGAGPGPAFGTQPPVVFGGNYRQPQPNVEPNSYMMAPEPGRPGPGFGFGSSTPRTPFGLGPLSNVNLQTASQNIIPAVLPFMGAGGKVRREPKPSMPMIKISRPENALRNVRRTNKFLEEMIHAFEHKLT